MKQILFTVVVLIAISSCANKDGLWTSKDKENAYNNCMFGERTDVTPDQRKKMCNCFVEKVMTASPDPVKQGEIKLDETMKINADCLAEAKK
jgi:hypothetical protein